MTMNPETDSWKQVQAAVSMASRTVEDAIVSPLHDVIEQGTETIGNVITPIAENPLVKYATKLPGVSWLMAALGQVDVEQVEQDVVALQQQYPLENPEQLAQRIISESAFKAARIGLLTNIVPPFALMLLAVDIAAVTALQAQMVYRIAAVYGFSLNEPARRGEVLALWGLSMGGSSVIKTGLSIVEVIPFLGAAVGIASNAALLHSLGHVAVQFYEKKQASIYESSQNAVKYKDNHQDRN
ncbi:EcsC family protein [Phormidium sp. CLA17]|uniref:EcsC family protein n=1 Tax=Leptolyngbya sp. Cla-17 TaxID=2803751 RepID=UPI0014918126|nr:EcsC family protein [Leptolyngbya sp. Cla-17]MBM0742458.1 EcsC family protein [Leptolyngbya sp. Cla-17]